MLRIDTLYRPLVLVALAASSFGSVACGGAPVDGIVAEESTSRVDDPAASESIENADESAPGVVEATAEEQALRPLTLVNGAEAPADEVSGGGRRHGREDDDRGFADAVADLPVDAPADALPVDETADGIGSTSAALTAGRAATLAKETARNADWLKASTSYYTHDTYMNETTGTRRTDCSGLVGYALRRVLKSAYDLVPHPTSFKPLAKDYYNYFAGRPSTASTTTNVRWRRIKSVKDLKAGDVIAWLSPQVSENTGHVMVVRDTPKAGRAGRNEWLIPIVDSTSTPHAFNGAYDSRAPGRDGVGRGTIGLKFDAAGAPVAYYWTGGQSPTPVYTKISLGRIE
jgi:hypothetical protein